MALRCALQLMKDDTEGKEFVERIEKRLHALSFHMRTYFWLDFRQLNDIYRYKTEEYSHTAVNKFHFIPVLAMEQGEESGWWALPNMS